MSTSITVSLLAVVFIPPFSYLTFIFFVIPDKYLVHSSSHSEITHAFPDISEPFYLQNINLFRGSQSKLMLSRKVTPQVNYHHVVNHSCFPPFRCFIKASSNINSKALFTYSANFSLSHSSSPLSITA